MIDTGLRIKETRIKRGMSQEDLAELSKVNLRTIQRIENNESTPRDKTLKLIYEALDIVVIDSEKIKIEKYTIWASLLTLLIIVSTFLGWIRRFKMYLDGEKMYTSFNGWNGYTLFSDYEFYNWLVSICCISLGFVVIGNSLDLLQNKLKYIALQIVVLILYIIGVFQWSFIQSIELRPGLFIVVIATILLVKSYRKKNRIVGAKSGHKTFGF